ncbi:flagellar biosynthesis protein FlhA [Ramlibacter alkalitolerans]|uniref:FHIPEP family type III secretion protein n=1 Tax=Ramlibacter alkalitolerans TaxID=2039631 RepID=A0ABS1JT37_9BURK|nr:flagellar biosynthesis protein FlhA [Ramlibacter alkalitolerans]MBL0427402.1 FHIPEP family type III secretion protein [Ramlibacter alkalitolerans]
MNALRRFLGRHTDVAMVLALLGVLLVLFLPIPRGLLDFLILANFSFAFLLLLLTFSMVRPVDFSTFPSLLLLATLFRLSLNVAATRLILAEGDAGRVIAAIGSHVVAGNFVVGLIVFFILVVVQFVVVTSGAQRVSEVAARFTLDSMPGQQMSIDADLNMGFIDQAEAQRRRRQLEKEAGFYGAMDGASKFVKGDAVAGILILLINIIGGLVIGILQHKMPWAQALQTYTLLTIGDGIVTQVPALVIAVGTGIIVTRSASDGDLGKQALRQVTAFPKTLVMVAAALAALLFLPGIPLLPAFSLFAAAMLVAWWARRARSDAPADTSAPAPESADPYAQMSVEPVEVRVGSRWALQVGDSGNLFEDRIGALRSQHALELGLVIPAIRFRSSAQLAPDAYELYVDGVLAGRGEARQGQLLAIHPGGDQTAVPGEATRDPTYGLPALWIDVSGREQAAAARYTLVDGATVFMTHLTEVLRRESATLLTRQETDRLLARVRQSQPSLVEELVPTVLAVGDVQKVLQNLLREKVSIRHLEAILETLADAGRATKDAAQLTEAVRQRLGHSICQSLAGGSGALHVLTLDPVIESRLLQGVQAARREGVSPAGVAIEPRLLEKLLLQLVQQAERMMKNNLLPVLLCAPELRRYLRSLCERGLPHLRVLSMSEIPHAIELKSYGTVTVREAGVA